MAITLERRSYVEDVAIADGLSTSKSLRVLSRLRRDIIAGRLSPGRKLSFGFLAQHYDVGWSPLREALCQLAAQGLVVLESQRGFHVAPVSRADLNDVSAVRRHIEVHALGLSVELGDAAWREQLVEASDAFSRIAARAGDPRPIDEEWQAMHRRYHFALIGACDSPVLLQFCKQIYDRFDRYRRLAIPTQALMAGPARDHHDITRASLAGRRDEAQALLSRHIDEIAEVVARHFEGHAQGGA